MLTQDASNVVDFTQATAATLLTVQVSPLAPGSRYKTIMKYADAIGQPAIKTTASTSTKGKTVASLVKMINSDEEDDVVAAFAPLAVLRNGTDSGESDNVSGHWSWTIKM